MSPWNAERHQLDRLQARIAELERQVIEVSDGECARACERDEARDRIAELEREAHALNLHLQETHEKRLKAESRCARLVEALERIESGCSFPADDVQRAIRDAARAALADAAKPEREPAEWHDYFATLADTHCRTHNLELVDGKCPGAKPEGGLDLCGRCGHTHRRGPYVGVCGECACSLECVCPQNCPAHPVKQPVKDMDWHLEPDEVDP